MKGRYKRLHAGIAFASVLMLAQQASASELVYQPINPAFGGNPFNGPFLIETATLQNGHEPNTREPAAAVSPACPAFPIRTNS